MEKKSSKIIIAIAMLMAIVSIFSCEKMDVDAPTPNVGIGAKYVAPSDSLIGYSYRDARERFVEAGVEYSFVHVDVYKQAGEVPETERRAWIRPLNHIGVDPQYFHFADTTFTTTRGKETVLAGDEMTEGSWKASATPKNQLWEAKNKSENEFSHSTTTSAARVVYTYPGTDKLAGYTVEFAAPTWTLAENTLPNEEVIGVSFEGKTWDAVKYTSNIAANFEIAEAFRMSGEASNKEIEVSNLAFFLKHVVDTKLENLDYVGKFFAKENVLDTEVEKVSGELVTRDNGDVIKKDSFELGMNLSLSLSQPENQTVNSEKELKDTGNSHNRGNVTETPLSSDVFTGKKSAGQDSITLSDGVVINAPFSWESWSWGAEQLPYAQIVDREVSVKSEKNEQLSTASTLVYTVTVTMSVKVGFVGIDRKDETHEVSVKYNRSYNQPDDYSTEYEQVGYVLELQNETASKVSTKDQHNTILTVVKNRGEVVSSTEAKYPLDLYASIASGDTVKVDKPFKPSVIAIEDHADKGDWKSADDSGFAVRWVKDSQTIRVKGGNVIEYEWYNEIQGRNNKDVYDHAEVKGISAGDVTFSEPVLVDSVKTEKSITKVYRVDAQFTPTVTSTASAQTKAGSSNVNTLAVATSFYQMVVEGDEYIEGKDEVEWYTRTNGNVIEVGGKLYEHYTISGKVLVDEQQTTMEPTLKGVDAEDVVVESADGYSLTGNGLNKTGNGVYNNYLTKGNNSYPYTFNYNAPASATVKLNGKGGKGATKTFNASFVIEDGSLNSGNTTTDNTYTVYPKTSNVKGTYTVEGKAVVLGAQATRNLKVAIPQDEFVSDRIVKTVTKSGNSVNYNVKLYETWSISGEKLKDEKSGTLTPSLTGSNGGDIVVKNVNFTTSGNGYNGTGSGTYTDNASNGENSFSNSYSWNAPASVKVNLNGTKGTKSETISTSWSIAEAGQNIGNKVAETGYDVYPYTNTVKGTYTVEDKTVELTANATKSLKVKRDIPKIIPEEWGKIKSAGFSAVPSHLDGNGNYVDGNNVQTATSCMTIVTDKGAVPVLFGWADQDPRVPTTDQILASPFTTGSYTSDYNSGYYNGNGWVPAIAKDTNTGISYSIPGVPDIRFIRNESLVMWGWRNGNYSTVLSGYTCSVEDGTLTVTYNGQVVLELR